MDQKSIKSLRIYKLLFWILFSVNILFGFWLLWNVNESNQQLAPGSTQYISDSVKTELQGNLNSAFFRIDSLRTVNDKLMAQLGRPNYDTTNLTEPQKRIIRLMDSTYQVKDSILAVEKYMDSLDKGDLNITQQNNYITTIGLLGMIKLKLDFNLDKERIGLLKTDASSLQTVIAKYDKRIKKLSKLTDRLTSLSKFINVSISIFSTAIFQNIVIAPLKT